MTPCIRRWGVETGKKLSSLGNSWQHIFFSLPDGRTLLTCGYAAMERWDTESGKELATPPQASASQVSVLLSPDGKTLLTLGGYVWDTWDAATGKRIDTVDDKLRRFLSCTFSPDGKQFVADTGDGITTFDTSTCYSFTAHGRDHSQAA